MLVHAYIGIGSNLVEPQEQVKRAIERLKNLCGTYLQAVSPLYQSAAIGQLGQPDYINAAAHLLTELEPRVLLDALQAIELAQGRLRDGAHWGPRTLDLDILLYGDTIIRSARLNVPHPEMTKRAFVLEPLHAIAPDLSIPGLGSVAMLLQMLDRSGTTLLEAALLSPERP